MPATRPIVQAVRPTSHPPDRPPSFRLRCREGGETTFLATRGGGQAAPRAAPRYCTDMIVCYLKYTRGALGAPSANHPKPQPKIIISDPNI